MAKDNFGKWQGGDNFVYSPQWGSGQSRDGSQGKKKYGDAAMRKRTRFNPNPTACSHPGCQIKARSKRDKENYLRSKSV